LGVQFWVPGDLVGVLGTFGEVFGGPGGGHFGGPFWGVQGVFSGFPRVPVQNTNQKTSKIVRQNAPTHENDFSSRVAMKCTPLATTPKSRGPEPTGSRQASGRCRTTKVGDPTRLLWTDPPSLIRVQLVFEVV